MKINDIVEGTEVYKAGYDCGLNGANTVNCNFKFFATEKSRAEWEAGKKQGEHVKRISEL